MSKNTDSVLGTILWKLERVRPAGRDRWTACCPAHRDRTPSLSIKSCSDGTILLHCFAGCSIDKIVNAIGIEMRDLFVGDRDSWQPTHRRQPRQAAKPAQRAKVDVDWGYIVREINFDYLDEHARPFVRIVRREFSGIDPKKGKPFKDCVSCRWDNKSRSYVKGIRGLAFIPFNAPAVKEAETILWVEGEKKACVLAATLADRKPEIVASTRWGGSGAPLQAELIPWFHGKHVIIFADDDTTGIGYARATAIAIRHVVKSVKILLPSAAHDIEDLVNILQLRRTT